MTREQDARETLRALSDAATPGRWIALNGSVGSWDDEQLIADAMREEPGREEADAAFIAAAVNYVRAALLPSPPATTGAGETRAEVLERACEVMHDAYEYAAVQMGWETQAASRKPWAEVPPANRTTMRYAVNALLNHLAASSPPATDGDAAALTPGQHFDVFARSAGAEEPLHVIFEDDEDPLGTETETR